MPSFSLVRHFRQQIAYQKMLSTFAAERDISAQKTSHILLGCPLVHTSRQVRNLCVSPNLQETVNFESPETERIGMMKRYRERHQNTNAAVIDELQNVSLLNFVQNWTWRGKRYSKRGGHGALPYVVSIWPRYQPDPEDEDQYENWCYARMILHHPFTNEIDLLDSQPSWKDAYQTHCLGAHHIHIDDTLPKATDVSFDVPESDSESIPGEDDEDEDFQAQWMQEARRRPGDVTIEDEGSNLGKRDIDLAYDWNAASGPSGDIEQASKWSADQIKTVPNDAIQVLPEFHHGVLKGEQHELFLQVMAYFKKIKSGGHPPPFRINIDGTAGTGKSMLIWTITTALGELFHDELDGKDPTVRLAPTGVPAFGIRG
ncbi:hypothetical protein C8J56DRAFT_785160, partial [Mycena floridula]